MVLALVWGVAAGQVRAGTPPIILDQLQREGVARFDDGTLAAMFVRDDGTSGLTYSFDDGQTYSAAAGSRPVGNIAAFAKKTMVDSQGNLHGFYKKLRGETSGTGYNVDRFLDVWEAQATPGGQSIGVGKQIFAGYEGGLQGEPLELASGRLVLPFQDWQANVSTEPPFGPNYVSSLYSDDFGQTWNQWTARLVAPVSNDYLGSEYGANIGAVEPSLLQLNDGRLWMVMRTQTGKLYESFSTDGDHWTTASPTEFAGSNGPAQTIRLDDGRIVLFWNNAELPRPVDGGSFFAGRDALHAAVSSDEGQSWSGFREILLDPNRNNTPPKGVDHGTAYPVARLNIAGDQIYLNTGQLNRYSLLIDPDWLEDETASTDFSDGLAQWSTFKRVGAAEDYWQNRTQGGSLVSDPAGGGNQVLQLTGDRFSFDSADGATWNFPAGMSGTLTMPVYLNPGFGGGVIALEDRFFDPIDPQSESMSIFSFRLGSDGRVGQGSTFLSTGEWVTLELAWDAVVGELVVSADGEEALTVAMNDSPFGGVNYLHLRALSPGFFSSNPGFLVRSVDVVVPEPAAVIMLLPLALLGRPRRSYRRPKLK